MNKLCFIYLPGRSKQISIGCARASAKCVIALNSFKQNVKEASVSILYSSNSLAPKTS